MQSVGIIGYGWVGKAMRQMFPDAYTYDDALLQGSIPRMSKDDAYAADIVFICVPTPNKPDGSLDASVVEECVARVNYKSLVVIRSTVQPGTCDYLAKRYKRPVVFQPEYLGETTAHPLLDPKTRPFLIFGGDKRYTRKVIELYQTVYNANVLIRQTSLKEAEVIKLSENRAIAFKVAQCQELYDVCEAANIDYYTVRDAVYADDPRFNLWWTFVYPESRGFNSKCIPKDVYGWAAWAETIGIKPELTTALLKTNEKYITGRN